MRTKSPRVCAAGRIAMLFFNYPLETYVGMPHCPILETSLCAPISGFACRCSLQFRDKRGSHAKSSKTRAKMLRCVSWESTSKIGRRSACCIRQVACLSASAIGMRAARKAGKSEASSVAITPTAIAPAITDGTNLICAV